MCKHSITNIKDTLLYTTPKNKRLTSSKKTIPKSRVPTFIHKWWLRAENCQLQRLIQCADYSWWSALKVQSDITGQGLWLMHHYQSTIVHKPKIQVISIIYSVLTPAKLIYFAYYYSYNQIYFFHWSVILLFQLHLSLKMLACRQWIPGSEV